MNKSMRNDVISYIDEVIQKSKNQNPSVNYDDVRNNAIAFFATRTEDLESLKPIIDAAFSNAIKKLSDNTVSVEDEELFQMAPDEESLYMELKQQSISKKNELGLNNVKKLTLQKPGLDSNKGFASFIVVMAIVALLVGIIAAIALNVIK